jgi:SAM-dependent methyltransferase
MGILDQCLFEVADMRQLINRLPAFDIVLYVACGRVFGDMQQTITALRTFVRPRGFIVIGDVYRVNGAAGVNPDIPDYEAVAAALTSHGDRIVAEKHGLTQESVDVNQLAARVLERRARELMSLYPGLHAAMWEYIEAHRHIGAAKGSLVPALWIVQKAENGQDQDR